MGSLVCALASFLHARQQHGQWLVRIEDIDPPREQPGAASAILYSLQCHGLKWDGEVLYQHTRAQAYRQALHTLAQQQRVYRCACSRKRLASLAVAYDGYCRTHPADANRPAAWRFDVTHAAPKLSFDDGVQGVQTDFLAADGDFVVHRKDGLFAYQLAVVVDDIYQNITHVVRGDDLLDCTGKQIALFAALKHQPPHYAHIPVVLDEHGNKLSKQNHAPALDNQGAAENLRVALRRLGVNAALSGDIPALLAQGVAEFSLKNLG